MTDQEKFVEIFNNSIKRQGSKELLEWLKGTDFFTAPASTKYHLAEEGGLCKHSIHVYERLKALCELEKNRGNFDVSNETIAICGLLHDLCKTNFYAIEMRNKKIDNKWVSVPTYTVDDVLPYGHGEKSVYIISGFMRLTRDEAFAIRFHMGAWQDGEKQNAGNAFNMFPLATLTHLADMSATFLDETT